MRIFKGRALHKQIAIGNLHFFHRVPPVLQRNSKRSPEEEEERYLWAQKQAIISLAALYDRALHEVGQEMAAIFSIHSMILEDSEAERRIRAMILTQGVTAEYAVYTVGCEVAEMFAQMDNEYMRQRSIDIQDITRRMVLRLLNSNGPDHQGDRPAILVAETFFPSEVMELDHRKLLGLISTRDGVTSHTGLLLDAYHIPTMVDVEIPVSMEGHLCLMDGFAQTLYLDPEDSVMEQLRLDYQAGGKPEESEEEILV